MMETVGGLLEQGWRTTLLAQVCEIEGHPGLRWIKVPAPSLRGALLIMRGRKVTMATFDR
jgi:hypothetical protein